VSYDKDRVVALAKDLASFHNTEIAEAERAVWAAMVGCEDYIRRYGASTAGLFDHEALDAIVAQTQDAAGDWDRCSDSVHVKAIEAGMHLPTLMWALEGIERHATTKKDATTEE
jgi:hypothetical protein